MAKETKKAASVGDWLGPETSESATNQEHTDVWRPMAEIGVLSSGNSRVLTPDGRTAHVCVWRVTRQFSADLRRWMPVEYWVNLLDGRRIDWEPVGWRLLEPGEAGRAV